MCCAPPSFGWLAMHRCAASDQQPLMHDSGWVWCSSFAKRTCSCGYLHIAPNMAGGGVACCIAHTLLHCTHILCGLGSSCRRGRETLRQRANLTPKHWHWTVSMGGTCCWPIARARDCSWATSMGHCGMRMQLQSAAQPRSTRLSSGRSVVLRLSCHAANLASSARQGLHGRYLTPAASHSFFVCNPQDGPQCPPAGGSACSPAGLCGSSRGTVQRRHSGQILHADKGIQEPREATSKIRAPACRGAMMQCDSHPWSPHLYVIPFTVGQATLILD